MRHLGLLGLAAAPLLLTAGATGALAQTATGAVQQPATQPDLKGGVSALNPELLYKGWRARLMIGQPVSAASDGRIIGAVGDIIVDKDGRATALVIEGGGTVGLPEAVYRVPWSNVDLTLGRAGVRAELTNTSQTPQYALFPGTEGVPTLPREFRVSEVLGDYARLQSGYGYGLVTDAVFASDGRLSAVLVTRDAASGGGATAFPFYGTAGPWDPGLSYYGLPFVTEGQARGAGLKVDATRFTAGAL